MKYVSSQLCSFLDISKKAYDHMRPYCIAPSAGVLLERPCFWLLQAVFIVFKVLQPFMACTSDLATNIECMVSL